MFVRIFCKFLVILVCWAVGSASAGPASTQLPEPHAPEQDIKCVYTREYDAVKKEYVYLKQCNQHETLDERFNAFLSSITPDSESALQKKIAQEKAIQKSKYGISFFEPTYVLPFYYTGNPYQQIYRGRTPENQSVQNEEFKGQLSIQFPVVSNLFHSHYSIHVSYTQLSYWQVYAKSQYFRETNYEPALYISDNFLPNWLGSLGIVHQSNGRGGDLERSWNRVYLDISFSGEHWLISLKPWVLVFQSDSSDIHNPDIANYLGYGRAVFAVQFHHQEVAFMVRNALESGFSRGALEVTYQFPIHGRVSGFIQFFSGYGQSLIEYNHYTNSGGIGIVLSNWI